MVYAANTTAATATDAATTTIAATAAASSNRSWHQIADYHACRHHPVSGHNVDGR
jgi:hypothetical protein